MLKNDHANSPAKKSEAAKAKRKRRARLSPEERAARWEQSLQRAVTQQSTANYDAIFVGFVAKGIPVEDVLPRQNVFTFNAWRALGRQVRKGESGVKVVTVVQSERGENEKGEPNIVSFPTTTTVFHVSQTDLIANEEDAKKSPASKPISN